MRALYIIVGIINVVISAIALSLFQMNTNMPLFYLLVAVNSAGLAWHFFDRVVFFQKIGRKSGFVLATVKPFNQSSGKSYE